MSQQKFSHTNTYEKWSRLRLFAWVVPAAIFIALALMHAPEAQQVASQSPDFGIVLLTFALVDAAWALYIGLALSVAWVALCHFMRKRARAEATFDARRDIDYYREKLVGASPTLVSLIADLRIEPRKDVAASLLRLKMKKIIDYDSSGEARVIATPVPNLSASDRFLVDYIASGSEEALDLTTWANLAEQEALETPYLCPNPHGSKKRLAVVFEAGVTGFIMPMISFIIGSVCASAIVASPIGAPFKTFIEGAGQTAELAAIAQTDPLILVTLVLFMASLFIATYGILFPIIKAVSAVVSITSRTNDLLRTPEGDDLSECVYGLRNWIRDFTNMSQADRDAVTVWDDFFVYAVALDEGDIAVDQILPLKDIAGSELAYTAKRSLRDVATTTARALASDGRRPF